MNVVVLLLCFCYGYTLGNLGADAIMTLTNNVVLRLVLLGVLLLFVLTTMPFIIDVAGDRTCG